ncbi:MAG TPA: hypothetical protein VMJ12_08370 [Candidatus Acidoferrales bacterium]|nr:hypothetical protein [Candidatus Acidoferrales bacterium]
MKVPAEKLRSVLGLTSINYVQGQNTLAVIDSTLADSPLIKPETT